MKNIITIILIIVLCNLAIFLMIAFYELTFDISKWKEIQRLLQVVYGALFSAASTFIYYKTKY